MLTSLETKLQVFTSSVARIFSSTSSLYLPYLMAYMSKDLEWIKDVYWSKCMVKYYQYYVIIFHSIIIHMNLLLVIIHLFGCAFRLLSDFSWLLGKKNLQQFHTNCDKTEFHWKVWILLLNLWLLVANWLLLSKRHHLFNIQLISLKMFAILRRD